MPVLSGGNVIQPGSPIFAEVTATETATAGVYTATVDVPAGAWLLEVAVHAVALWDTATSATGKVGDVADDDGIFTAIDLKATDLLAGETISASGGRNTAGGKQGADLTADTWNRRYLATVRAISLIVTTVGSGTAGRTRLLVAYTDPTTPAAAAKV